MTSTHPFRRAIVLALAWWLVGLGIDLGADSRSDRKSQPTAAVSGSTRTPRDLDPPARLSGPIRVTSAQVP